MTDAVPTFPRIEATIAADQTGVVAINGVSQAVSGADDQAVRAEIIALVTATAIEFNRPVRLTTRDALGEQILAVYPDGHVEALTALTEHRGNVSEVARALHCTRMQVHRWTNRFGVSADEYRV